MENVTAFANEIFGIKFEMNFCTFYDSNSFSLEWLPKWVVFHCFALETYFNVVFVFSLQVNKKFTCQKFKGNSKFFINLVSEMNFFFLFLLTFGVVFKDSNRPKRFFYKLIISRTEFILRHGKRMKKIVMLHFCSKTGERERCESFYGAKISSMTS